MVVVGDRAVGDADADSAKPARMGGSDADRAGGGLGIEAVIVPGAAAEAISAALQETREVRFFALASREQLKEMGSPCGGGGGGDEGGWLTVGVGVGALVLVATWAWASIEPADLPATLLACFLVYYLGVALRTGPTLRPGPGPVSPDTDINGFLLFDGYNHVEADERVFRTLSLGIASAARAVRDGDGVCEGGLPLHHLLQNYHLQEPRYQVLGLAAQNYDRPAFHHPPLFAIVAYLWEAELGLPYPLLPVCLSALVPILFVVCNGGVLGLSGKANFWATVSLLLCPTAAFCSQKFWSDTLLPPLMYLAMVSAIAGARARGAVAGLFFAGAGTFLGLALLVKVTALGGIPPLGLCVCVAAYRKKSARGLVVWSACLLLPVAALYGWWIAFFVERTGSADVLSAMWPSEELAGGGDFMVAAGDRHWSFYATLMARIWPASLLAVWKVVRPAMARTLFLWYDSTFPSDLW
ncbi:hypothetical protein TeGR_g955 [Tetraparma gracilis]|uniref:Glycosyltransferase RgtA/B/C/D-like domain-containing protein n=1 Tax=Tetraparma gracilis TaxID=2962635 RepID=A0ABQ6MJZ8_9STRA|nr:hypothetical protein TeGR_g955 [Tetraparma gracilis]